jgi:glycosyltransferase involved in cell wall biosynthesis
MMHIALDAQLVSDQESYRGAGVNNYSRQLLAALGAQRCAGKTPWQFSAFVHARRFDAPGVALNRTRLPLQRPAARIAWEQIVLPGALARARADLVHGLVNVLPLASRLPGVVTVHDLTFVRTPELLPPLKRAYQTWFARVSVARARKVIAVSRQTAADLGECFGVPAGRVTVVYNGVAPEFRPGPAEERAQFRIRKGLPMRYLLYLGTLEPRKNLELLVGAFARWRRQAAPEDRAVQLVLAGAKGWYYEEIFRRVQELGLSDAVSFPGFIPAAELPDWYRGAEGFLYPSLMEGFGLPVLEAMACGVPVVCSQFPSLLEVAGNAALSVSAHDEEALAHAIQLLTGQPELRAALAAQGLARARMFTWRRCAEETIAVYERVLAEAGTPI